MDSKMEFHVILCFMRYSSFELFHPFKSVKTILLTGCIKTGSRLDLLTFLLASFSLPTLAFSLHGLVFMDPS